MGCTFHLAPETKKKLQNIGDIMMATKTHIPSNDINRLFAAAVIDREFCQLLLTNPTGAIVQGYYGEKFQLPPETTAQLQSIHAVSLSEFARQLTVQNNGEHSKRRVNFLPERNIPLIQGTGSFQNAFS
jgi:hypothetical protein